MTITLLYVVAMVFVISQQEIGRPLMSRSNMDELSDKKNVARKKKDVSHTYVGQKNVDIVFKNESASRSGSLKHRYTWSLMMWALIEGHVKNGTTIYEASSGNTAASLAYMCRLLHIPFVAIEHNVSNNNATGILKMATTCLDHKRQSPLEILTHCPLSVLGNLEPFLARSKLHDLDAKCRSGELAGHCFCDMKTGTLFRRKL
ncbi:hypothetical protein ANCDUO_18090 [Ancylostoma duodenale]|uniref:Tryptophan synthase beta chain-like PALP domain-containing protein n=1 Tax=Ancylostoma duodenale TaxID=51022 RepID=A0A0C2G456_9BILA|nr:hypothetical protein ANCDUO_18090 [Ancylostoma duodenale]